MSDPTPAELVRRIEDVAKAMERLTSTLEQSYVRKDVYDAQRRGDNASLRSEIKDVTDDVRELKTRTERSDAFRRQIIAGIAVSFIGTLFTLFLTLNYVKGG